MSAPRVSKPPAPGGDLEDSGATTAARGARRRDRVAALGSIPRGRQWGTVREDYSADGTRVGLLPARPRPLARLPLGRGRPRSASATDRGGCASRWRCGTARSDPQGAAVRAERARGQPRRGRQGGLLLPRRDADALVPARRCTSIRSALPLRGRWSRRTPPGRDDPEYELIDTGVFDDDRYFDVVVEYAKAAPDDILVRITRHQPRARRGALHLLPTLWFRNTWAWGRWRADRPRLARAAGRRVPAQRTHRGWAVPARLRWRRVAAVHRERDQQQRLFGVAERAAATSRTPSTTYVVDGDASGRSRQRAGTKAAARFAPTSPAGGESPSCAAPVATAQPADDPFARRRRAPRAAPSARPTSSTRASRRAIVADDERARPAAGVRRAALEQAVLPYDVAAGSTAIPASPRRRRAAARPQRGLAAPHNADVLSMPDNWEYPWFAAWDLGVPLHPAGDGRPRLREGPAAAPDARVVHAPQRPAARLRVGVRRRQPAGARLGRLARLRDRSAAHAAGATAPSSSASSTSCCSTSPGG